MEPTAIELREQEVAAYEQNIALYNAMASALPSEWPEHLKHLKNAKNRHEEAAKLDNLEDVALVSQLWAHDTAVSSIRTEMVEKAKSEAILAALKAAQ